MQEILFGTQSLRIRPKKGVKLYFNFPEKNWTDIIRKKKNRTSLLVILEGINNKISILLTSIPNFRDINFLKTFKIVNGVRF